MSWNGTVTCGYCWGKGHNRRGCPQRKEMARKDPEGREARMLKREKAEAKQRRCGFCKKTKHNVRSCEMKKAKIALLIKKEVEFKKEFVRQVKEYGICTGAIVSASAKSYYNPGAKFLITGINWDMVDISCVSDKIFDIKEVFRFIESHTKPNLFEVSPISRGLHWPPDTISFPAVTAEDGSAVVECCVADRWHTYALVSGGILGTIEVPEDFLVPSSEEEIKRFLRGLDFPDDE